MNIYEYVDVNNKLYKKQTQKYLEKILNYYTKKYRNKKIADIKEKTTDYTIHNIFPSSKKDKWFIFVSSTFQDMQLERDILKRDVLPRVNDYARKYGNTVEFIDLRWGIDSSSLEEEEKRHKKVLQNCFDEIDKSRPVFIGLLGDRYGWIPPDSIVDNLDNIEIDDRYKGISVTAMEIEYGVIKDRRCEGLFYFRNLSGKDLADSGLAKRYFEDGPASEKLQKLKEKIRSNDNNHVREYSATLKNNTIELEDSWADIVYEDIIKTLSRYWKESNAVINCPQAREWIEQAAYIRNLSSFFVERAGLLEELRRFANCEAGKEQVLFMYGPSGSGKSSVVSKLVSELKNDMPIGFVTCGRTEFTNNINGILRMLIWELSETLGINSDIDNILDFKKLQEEFFGLLWKLSNCTEKALIVVDALDQLVESNFGNELNWLIGSLPPNIRVICTSIFNVADSVRGKFEAEYKYIGTLKIDEQKSIIKEILKRNHKELSEDVTAFLLHGDDEEGTVANPLYLSLVVSDLYMMDRFDFEGMNSLKAKGLSRGEAINQYIVNRIKELGYNPLQAYNGIVSHMNERVGDDYVLTLEAIIATSRYGVSEINIERIMKWIGINYDPSDFAWIRNYVSDHMVLTGNGCWDFSHSIMRKSLFENRLSFISDLNKEIVSYLEKFIGEAFAQKEIVHHYFLAGEYEKAFDLILRKDIDSESINEGMIYEFVVITETEGEKKELFFKKLEEWVKSKSYNEMREASSAFRQRFVPAIPASVSTDDKLRFMQVIIDGLSSHEDLSVVYDESLFEEVMDDPGDALTEIANECGPFESLFKGLGVIVGAYITCPFKMLHRIVSLSLSDSKEYFRECVFAYIDCAFLCLDNGDLSKSEEYMGMACDIATWYRNRSFGAYKYKLLALTNTEAGNLIILAINDYSRAAMCFKEARKNDIKWYRLTYNKESLLIMADINRFLIDDFNEIKVPLVGLFLKDTFRVQKRIYRRCREQRTLYDAMFLQKCAETSAIHSIEKNTEAYYLLEHQLRQQIYIVKQDFDSEWELLRSEKDYSFFTERTTTERAELFYSMIYRMEALLNNHPFDLARNIVLVELEKDYADFMNKNRGSGVSMFVYEDAVRRCGKLAKVNDSEISNQLNSVREKCVYSLIEVYKAIGESGLVIKGLCDCWSELLIRRFKGNYNPKTISYYNDRIVYVAMTYGSMDLCEKSTELLKDFYDILVNNFVGNYDKQLRNNQLGFNLYTLPISLIETARELVKKNEKNGDVDLIKKITDDLRNSFKVTKDLVSPDTFTVALKLLDDASVDSGLLEKALTYCKLCFKNKNLCDPKLEFFEGTLSDGREYRGDVLCGIPHGEGILKFNNNVYTGYLDCGKFSGLGTLKEADGTVKIGQWYRGMMEGLCSIDYASGDHYEGETHLNRPEGKGIKTYKEACITYEGHFYRGAPNGPGVVKNSDGEITEEGFYRNAELFQRGCEPLTVEDI